MIKLEIFVPTTMRLQTLEEKLSDVGVHSLSATEMKIFSKNSQTRALYRGVEKVTRHSHRLKVEIVIPKEHRLQLFKILKECFTEEQQKDTRIFTTPMWQTRSVGGEFFH